MNKNKLIVNSIAYLEYSSEFICEFKFTVLSSFNFHIHSTEIRRKSLTLLFKFDVMVLSWLRMSNLKSSGKIL
jgi:hypothetical protein